MPPLPTGAAGKHVEVAAVTPAHLSLWMNSSHFSSSFSVWGRNVQLEAPPLPGHSRLPVPQGGAPIHTHSRQDLGTSRAGNAIRTTARMLPSMLLGVHTCSQSSLAGVCWVLGAHPPRVLSVGLPPTPAGRYPHMQRHTQRHTAHRWERQPQHSGLCPGQTSIPPSEPSERRTLFIVLELKSLGLTF